MMACVVLIASVFSTEATAIEAAGLDRAKRATIGILEDQQDQRTPDRHGKILIRGTGFHLRDGYIVTARHAVERHTTQGAVIPKQIRLMTMDFHELAAELVGESSYADVVLYRLQENHRAVLTDATPFAAGDMKSGDDVFTIGYPLGWGPTMAFGHLGNMNTFLQTVDTRLIQADLSVCSGNSGGGMFNAAGEVVGVMHAIIQTEKDPQERHCSRLAFAVPAPLAQRIVMAALSGQPLSFSRLGIQMTSVKDGTKWRVAVKEVSDPAKSAGLGKTDVLMAIDGMDITDAAQLKNYLIEKTKPGQQVEVRVRRGDGELTFVVVLAGG
jgi:S1-C subfamily serine protease